MFVLFLTLIWYVEVIVPAIFIFPVASKLAPFTVPVAVRLVTV